MSQIENIRGLHEEKFQAMSQLMGNNNNSLDEKIADLKTRLDRGKGRNSGSTDARSEKRLDLGAALQAIAVAATIVGLVIVALHK